MAKNESKDQGEQVETVDLGHAHDGDTAQQSPTIQEQADAVLDGTAINVDNGEHQKQLDAEQAERDEQAASGASKTSKASDSK